MYFIFFYVDKSYFTTYCLFLNYQVQSMTFLGGLKVLKFYWYNKEEYVGFYNF